MKQFNKTLILATASAAVVPIMGVAANEAPQKKRPNIIYIMSDDHTSYAIGAYNSRLSSLNMTPTIDAMAQEGIIFDNVFCNNSISTPSRASIMTGQYSHINRILTLDEKLLPSEQYLANEMKDLGYQTAMVGKWHLGCEPASFDYYNVFTQMGEQGKYFDPELASSDNKSKPFPYNVTKHMGYCSDIVTDITLDWFKEKRDPNKPFFVMHHFKAPHDDFEFAPRYADYLADVDIPLPETMLNREGFGSEGTRGKNNSLDYFLATSISSRNTYRNYVDMYNIDLGDDEKNTIAAYNEYLKRYLRCVKGVDDNLARLFAYLKEAGLWDNTVIIYTGDQGMMLGEHDLQDKRWMYEECLRMPFIMRIPGSSVGGGSHNDLLIQNVDFAPTILALAGAEKTPEYMQGRDFSSVFEGQKPHNWRDAIYYRYWMHLIHHNVPAHLGIRTDDYKLIFFYGRHYDPSRYGQSSMWWLTDIESQPIIEPTPVSFELYDMKNDPMESTNLANDPAYAEALEMMKKKLLEVKTEVGDDDAANPDILELIEQYF
ncbi:MAG: sulfatase [Rikenellaceae bacterium]